MAIFTVTVESDHPDTQLIVEAAIEHLLEDEWGGHAVDVILQHDGTYVTSWIIDKEE